MGYPQLKTPERSVLQMPSEAASNHKKGLTQISYAFCVLAIFVTAAAQFYSYLYWNLEDSYIIYRIVRNLLLGNGWAYNIGQVYNPSTSVLNTVLTTGFAFAIQDIPLAAHLVSGLSIFFVGFFTFRLLALQIPQAFAAFAAIATVQILASTGSWGLEPALLLALILWFIELETKNKNSWGVLALAVLARPDAILLVGLKLTYDLIFKREISFKGLALFAAILSPWAIFSFWKFGELFPATFKNKVWQGSSGFWGSGYVYLKGLAEMLRSYSKAGYMALALALLSSIPLIKTRSKLLYLAIFIAAQQAAYAILNVPAYHWYFSLLKSGTVLFAFLSLGWLLSFLPFFKSVKVQALLTTLLIFLVYRYSAQAIREPNSNSGNQHYFEAAAQINATNVGPGTLAAVEVGTLGYFIDRPIFDFIGLTSPNRQVLSGEYIEDFFKAKPKIVLTHVPIWEMEKAVVLNPAFEIQYGSPIAISTKEVPLQYFVLQSEAEVTQEQIDQLVAKRYGQFIPASLPIDYQNVDCAIDRINQDLVRGRQIKVKRYFTTEGWFAEPGSQPPNVWLRSKTEQFSIQASRLSRPDIVTHFNRPDLENSGFKGGGVVTDLKPGNYEIVLTNPETKTICVSNVWVEILP